jgi:hypothetical protein
MSCKVVVVDSTEAGQADFAADPLKVKTANPEIVRGLLLDPRLLLIDKSSMGLSPLMVQETFSPLRQLRDKGVSILMIEQNARSALKMSDYGLVLELGRTRMHDTAPAILARRSCSSAGLSKGQAEGIRLVTPTFFPPVRAEARRAPPGRPSPRCRGRHAPWRSPSRSWLLRRRTGGLRTAGRVASAPPSGRAGHSCRRRRCGLCGSMRRRRAA